MKMSKHLLNFVRAMILVAVACFAALNGRDWLLNWWGIRLSSEVYFGLAYILVAIVVWLATAKLYRGLISEVKYQQEKKTFPVQEISGQIQKEGEGIYRYPLRLVFMAMAVSVIFVIVPIIYGGPERSISMVGYMMSFGCAAVILIIAIFLFRYSVRNESGVVKIRGFSEYTFKLTDIAFVQAGRDKGGLFAVVKLTNGKVFRFSGMLIGFSVLVKILEDR